MHKMKSTEWLTARVPKGMKQQVSAIAKTERRTVSQVILLLLEEALKARQSKEQAAA